MVLHIPSPQSTQYLNSKPYGISCLVGVVSKNHGSITIQDEMRQLKEDLNFPERYPFSNYNSRLAGLVRNDIDRKIGYREHLEIMETYKKHALDLFYKVDDELYTLLISVITHDNSKALSQVNTVTESHIRQLFNFFNDLANEDDEDFHIVNKNMETISYLQNIDLLKNSELGKNKNLIPAIFEVKFHEMGMSQLAAEATNHIHNLFFSLLKEEPLQQLKPWDVLIKRIAGYPNDHYRIGIAIADHKELKINKKFKDICKRIESEK